MHKNAFAPLRLILSIMIILLALPMVYGQDSHAQNIKPRLIPFKFTPPPYNPREDVDTSHWARVCIMEMARPTFSGDKLNVQDKDLVLAWQRLYERLRNANLDAKISGVNAFVNKLAIPEVIYDNLAIGETKWPAPGEFIGREYYHSGGYAIVKYFALLALGVPETQLGLVVVEDTHANREHILLIVLNRDGFYVLDNRHDIIRPVILSHYLPEYFINYESAWLPKIDFKTVDVNTVFPTGKVLSLTNPPGSGKLPVQSHKYWYYVFNNERLKPTFKKDVLNVNDAGLKQKWKALYDELYRADIYEKLQKVNTFFNKNKYTDDLDNWGAEEYWATPREFMLKGRGDCEDYAVAKYYALKALGVPPKSMVLVSVIDDKSGMGHLVLSVSYAGSFYILDNNGNTVYRNGTKNFYKPRYYLNETGVWVRGDL